MRADGIARSFLLSLRGLVVEAAVGVLAGIWFGAVSAFLGLLAVIGAAYLVGVLIAVVRQRNEARGELRKLLQPHPVLSGRGTLCSFLALEVHEFVKERDTDSPRAQRLNALAQTDPDELNPELARPLGPEDEFYAKDTMELYEKEFATRVNRMAKNLHDNGEIDDREFGRLIYPKTLAELGQVSTVLRRVARHLDAPQTAIIIPTGYDLPG